MNRRILHVDMDAFFASIAQRDNPQLRSKPVIVGGHNTRRGVVASASYEARAFGVRSAMPIYQALERCPHAIVVPVEMDKYREVNHQLQEIWGDFSPLVEPLGFEEAYLDLTGTERLLGPLEEIAHRLKQAIQEETGLSCSVGGATTKLLAKIASKTFKPGGVGVIPKEEELHWLHAKDIAIIPGIGPKSQERLHRLGITTVGQLAQVPLEMLVSYLGPWGAELHAISQGMDPRPITPCGPPKSLGSEQTFEEDILDPAVIRRILLATSDKLAYRLRLQRVLASTLSLKIRYGKSFVTQERSHTLVVPTDQENQIYQCACELLNKTWDQGWALRLVGIRASNLKNAAQLSLFEPEASNRLSTALDQLRARHGYRVVTRGALVRSPSHRV